MKAKCLSLLSHHPPGSPRTPGAEKRLLALLPPSKKVVGSSVSVLSPLSTQVPSCPPHITGRQFGCSSSSGRQRFEPFKLLLYLHLTALRCCSSLFFILVICFFAYFLLIFLCFGVLLPVMDSFQAFPAVQLYFLSRFLSN